MRLTLALALAAALLALSAPVAAGRHRPPCSAARSHTVLHNSQARVYRLTDSDGVRADFACAYRYDHRYKLSDGVQRVRLVGRRVAYASAGGSFVTISVLNLRNGHQRDSGDIENLPNHDQPLDTDLILKSDGAVGWIVTNVDGNLSPPGSEVGRMDSRGENTLATGNDIQPHSLRVKGATLSWIQAGTTRTSSLR